MALQYGHWYSGGSETAPALNGAFGETSMMRALQGPELAIESLPAGLAERIAAALEKLAGAKAAPCDYAAADAFVFLGEAGGLSPVSRVSRVDIALLRGIDRMRDTLLANTERFARGFGANNALLWGARGTGKSALVKAVHAEVNARLAACPGLKPLKLVEIHREDIGALPSLMSLLRKESLRFLVFCDDLSFEAADTSYKSLKAALEGGIEGRPANALFYATSNRRHILPREIIENERATAVNPDDAVQEKISLSDRFGLWLGFHACSQEDYVAMVLGYAAHFGLAADRADIAREALEWAMTRGSRSGRTSWQYIQDLAGRLGRTVE